MTSFFPNSQNLVITGGQFIGNSSRVDGSHDGLDQLRHHAALGALLDSTERFDPPKCAPDTRTAIIQQILDWVTNPQEPEEASSVMWLYGPAGAGKSALAQTVAEILRGQKRLMASFFFSRTVADRSDGRLLIPTLSYQLLLSLPATRRSIKYCMESDPSVLNRASDTQMERLFIEPINQYALSWTNIFWKWSKKYIGFSLPPYPRLVVIDGLDECQDPKVQSDLLKVIGKSTERLEYPVRFLISCRPESHIIRVFNHDRTFQRLTIPTINLAMDLDADHDIRLYMQREFDDIKRTHPLRSYLGNSWPAPDAIHQLVLKASGQFIYASTVLRYVQSPKHRPDDRLNVVLGLFPPPSHEAPFSQLDTLYTHIFASIERMDIAVKIFGALIVPREKGNILTDSSTPRVLEELLLLKPGDVLLNLEELRSVVEIGGPDSPIRLFHASLADYLLNRSRSGRYWIDLSLAHSNISRGCLARIRNIISSYNFNHHDLHSSITSFVYHCTVASLTKELRGDLSHFNYISLWRVYIARHRTALVLDPFYFFFVVASFAQVLSAKNFARAQDLCARFATHLDQLNVYLRAQLKSTAVENYLAGVLSSISAANKVCNDLHHDHLPFVHAVFNQTPEFVTLLCTTQYLIILCELFSWDYIGACTSQLNLRYAHAVKQCLEFVGDEHSSTAKRLYNQFPVLTSLNLSLEEVHLNCAIALLPDAGYDSGFLKYLESFEFSSSLFIKYREQAVLLGGEMVKYRQRYHLASLSNPLIYI